MLFRCVSRLADWGAWVCRRCSVKRSRSAVQLTVNIASFSAWCKSTKLPIRVWGYSSGLSLRFLCRVSFCCSRTLYIYSARPLAQFRSYSHKIVLCAPLENNAQIRTEGSSYYSVDVLDDVIWPQLKIYRKNIYVAHVPRTTISWRGSWNNTDHESFRIGKK